MLEAAKSRRRSPLRRAASLCRAAGLLALVLAVSGCVGDGQPAPDATIVTGSIPASPIATAFEETSDRDAVRNAVSAADPGKLGPAGIPWADPATGTVGVITSLAQSETAAGTCRSFETSRHSYDGIALYAGEACRAGDGPWRLVEFGPKHAAATPEAAGAVPTG